jgi:hypothetical protein
MNKRYKQIILVPFELYEEPSFDALAFAGEELPDPTVPVAARRGDLGAFVVEMVASWTERACASGAQR